MSDVKKVLRELTRSLKSAQMFGQFPATETVNQALKIYYFKGREAAERVQLKTFKQWKDCGKRVKKGEKGFAFWTAPKHALKKGANPDAAGEEDTYEFFGVCYLFAESQVE